MADDQERLERYLEWQRARDAETARRRHLGLAVLAIAVGAAAAGLGPWLLGGRLPERSPRETPRRPPGQLNVTVCRCPSSLEDSLTTRCRAAICCTSPTVNSTVCGWVAVPRMSSVTTLPALSCAPVMSAECP